MGLYDRDYIRDDPPPGFSLGAQSMVVNLLIANVALVLVDFLFFENHPLSDYLGLRSDLLHHPWNCWQLLTAGFVHSRRDLAHIVFNMVGLVMFGRGMEEVYGRKEFLRFYLAAVVVASLVWIAVTNLLSRGEAIMYGASGAVMAVTVLYALHFRGRIVLTFGIPIPALAMAGIYMVFGVWGLGNQKSEVAHAAHLGGAAFALLYYFSGVNLGRLAPTSLSPRGLRPRPKLRVHEPESREENLASQVDRILEKISREGEASLSAKERRFLEDASRRYQQRRR
ncbi:MAG TPA: rhomboid family intramembrane serine protease [Pirellulales bacterium]|nr:rhomboid family intramembrane serine protease [Pirellulales bacterium]